MRHTIHCTAETMGASTSTTTRASGATASAILSVRAMPSVFGSTSANSRMAMVMMPVAISTPRWQELQRHRSRERRGQNVDEGVAEQHGADQLFPVGDQRQDVLGAPRTVFSREVVHARLGHRGQRRFRAGEERREQKQQNDGNQRKRWDELWRR